MMKKLAMLLILCSHYAFADSVLTGVIQNVEAGDYFHVVIKDAKGKEHSFFLGNHKSFDPLVAKPNAYKGKKARVHWHSVEKNIPEAGGKMKIEEATSIEILAK
ncbi:hypothetical protein JST97_28210 [bacterium]|nr:hypothetical protein [bacterium]